MSRINIEKVEDLGYQSSDGTWLNNFDELKKSFQINDVYESPSLINFPPEEETQLRNFYNESFLKKNPNVVLIKPLSETTRQYYSKYQGFYQGDSGLDLICPEKIIIGPGKSVIIDLEIACQTGSSFWLVPRSSIGKTPLRLSNSIGLIDQGYRGALRALVDHIKPDDPAWSIDAGVRLFQIALPDLRPIRPVVTDYLTSSARGSGGFGSTGV